MDRQVAVRMGCTADDSAGVDDIARLRPSADSASGFARARHHRLARSAVFCKRLVLRARSVNATGTLLGVLSCGVRRLLDDRLSQ
jgi:hypothetical protein